LAANPYFATSQWAVSANWRDSGHKAGSTTGAELPEALAAQAKNVYIRRN
jgi:predicted heme/steroid binding protein